MEETIEVHVFLHEQLLVLLEYLLLLALVLLHDVLLLLLVLLLAMLAEHLLLVRPGILLVELLLDVAELHVQLRLAGEPPVEVVAHCLESQHFLLHDLLGPREDVVLPVVLPPSE